jgi:hypothetical protein
MYGIGTVARLIGDDVTVEQLRGILRLRQAEARARLAAQTAGSSTSTATAPATRG